MSTPFSVTGCKRLQPVCAYRQLVKHFTSFAILVQLFPVPRAVAMPGKPEPAAERLNLFQRLTLESSELMTRAWRPRARHHDKPLNVGCLTQEATANRQSNLMSDGSHFARAASLEHSRPSDSFQEDLLAFRKR